MRQIIVIEYIINLLVLLIYHMHMFQLNSYFFKKHLLWIKNNYAKIIVQLLAIILPTLLLAFDNNIISVIAVLLFTFSILYNLPKKKTKIALLLKLECKMLLSYGVMIFLLQMKKLSFMKNLCYIKQII